MDYVNAFLKIYFFTLALGGLGEFATPPVPKKAHKPKKPPKKRNFCKFILLIHLIHPNPPFGLLAKKSELKAWKA